MIYQSYLNKISPGPLKNKLHLRGCPALRQGGCVFLSYIIPLWLWALAWRRERVWIGVTRWSIISQESLCLVVLFSRGQFSTERYRSELLAINTGGKRKISLLYGDLGGTTTTSTTGTSGTSCVLETLTNKHLIQ